MPKSSYQPSLTFERTAEEYADMFKSWLRGDQAFFAAGACHILAFTFFSLHPNEGYEIIYIKPKAKYPGTHVYITNGTWAFDHNGWTKEKELLEVTNRAYKAKYPGWAFKRILVTEDLETFCKANNHRPPAYFAYLPWERAYKYIQRFNSEPPKS